MNNHNKPIDSNNNNNYNNNHESLFWLVFHNKFLLNKIINYIQTIEWVKYNNHSQLRIENRLKLNYIYSLGLMIDQKLYSLLNYKLDNNEYILIHKISIINLFNKLSIDFYNNNNNNNNDNINSLKEIIIKLLSTRRNEFEIKDLTYIAVICNSIEVLRILINEPYSIVVYPSTLKYAIRHCHPSIVELILNSSSDINLISRCKNDETTLNTFIKLASKNEKHHSEMIECIKLNYTITTTAQVSTIINNDYDGDDDDSIIERPNKRFKPSSPSLSPSSLISKIETLSKFKRLMENLKDTEINNLSYENVISIYNVLYSNHDKLSTTVDNDDSIIRMKQFETLIILKLKQFEELKEYYDKFYKSFIRKYKEIIEECHDNEDKFDDDGNHGGNVKMFKQFLIIVNLFGNNEGGIDSEEVISDCINGTLVWNDLLLDIVIRKSEEEGPLLINNDRSTIIINWMLNCKNESIKSFLYNNFKSISFSTLELADYVFKESGLLNHLSSNVDDIDFENMNSYERYIYSHVWKEAIKQSDYNTLKYIESLEIDQIHSLSFKDCKPKLTSNQFNNLIQYLNETGFNGFDISDFVMFFQNTLEKSIQSDIKLNFKIENSTFIHRQELSSILLDSIMNLELSNTQLLLNSNIFNNSNNIHYNEIIDEDHIYFNVLNQLEGCTFDRDGKLIQEVENKSEIEIIETINKLIKLIKPTTTTTTTTTTTSKDSKLVRMDTHDSISVMVNYLFERLIKIKGVTMECVKSIYELIQQHSIIVKHTVYHSFWYLHIKDIKLSLFILNPEIVSFIYHGRDEDDDNEEFYNCFEYDEELLNLQDFLNPLEFTFDSIYNLSFDKLLEMLDNQLSPFNNNIDGLYENYDNDNNLVPPIIQNHLNKDLEYYLIIRRIDLFFKKLNQIKTQIILNSDLFSKTLILLDTPSNSLLPNSSSTLFKNNTNDKSTTTPSTSNLEFKQCHEIKYEFKLSKSVLTYCCIIMTIDEIIQLLQLNFNYQDFHQILLIESLYFYRFDISKLIIDNFKINLDKSIILNHALPNSFIIDNNYFNLFKIPPPCYQIIENEIYKLFKSIYIFLLDYYLKSTESESELESERKKFLSPTTSNEIKMNILNESFETIKSSFESELEDITINDFLNTLESYNIKPNEIFNQDEYQQLFKNLFYQYEHQQLQQQQINHPCNGCYCNYNNQEDNIFLESFCNGNIKLSESILSHYSNYQFKLTKQSITTTIKNKNIIIINHFKNNHKNMWNDDLINHLNNELNNDKDYKYLNK